MQYRKEVDGLRAIAVVPVLLFHAGFETFSGGFVGVDIFFVISGYLITSLILSEQEKGTFTIAGFYERRARRILPALFLVMAVTLIPAWIWMTPERLENFGQSLVAVSLFANNILLAITSDYFAPAADEKPLLHTWSLGVEEQYYIVFPVFIAIFWRLGRRSLLWLTIAAALLSFVAAELSWRTNPQTSFYLPQGRAWELLLGAITAFLASIGPSSTERMSVLTRNAIALVGMSMIVYAVFVFDSRTPFPSVYAILPTLGTALILHPVSEHTVVARWLRRPILVGIGLISYSLYLWHQPLLAFARITSIERPGRLLTSSLVIISGALAYLSWRYVEHPFRNRSFLSRSTIFSLTIAGILFFVVLGYAAHRNHGFEQRMPASYVAELNHFRQMNDERDEWLKPPCFINEHTLNVAEEALKRWGCVAQQTQARILVVGDSHAHDKAMALRLAGIAVDQMVDADCSIAPSRMTHRCRVRFDSLFDTQILKNYDVILLANRWNDGREVALFGDELDYWKKANRPIVLFGPMPEFGKLADNASFLVGQGKSRVQAVESLPYDQAKLAEVSPPLAAIAARHRLGWVDIPELFCELGHKRCSALSPDDAYLVVDYAHLSKQGGALLGQRIVTAMKLKPGDFATAR